MKNNSLTLWRGLLLLIAVTFTAAACSRFSSSKSGRDFEATCTQFLDCVMPGYLAICPSDMWPPADREAKGRYLECYKSNFSAMQTHSYKCADKLGLDRGEAWNADGKCDSLKWQSSPKK